MAHVCFGSFVFVAYCLMVNSRLVIVSFFVFRCSSVGRACKPGKRVGGHFRNQTTHCLFRALLLDTFFGTGDRDFKLAIATLNWIFTTSTSKW